MGLEYSTNRISRRGLRGTFPGTMNRLNFLRPCCWFG